MNPTAPCPTAPVSARPIRICFVNNSDNHRWEFRLGRYLAERLPCLQASPGHGRRVGNLRWNVEQLGPIEPSDAQSFRTLEQLGPLASEFLPEATVKDAITWLGDWIVKEVKARLPQHMAEALAHWLRDQWAQYVPQLVLAQCDWIGYFWQCIRLPDNARLRICGQDYGVLPCLAGHVEAHPVGLQANEGDIDWRWRHEVIEQEATGPHPQDTDRTRYAFTTFFTPAHLCDTLAYSFSEIRQVLDPVNGWQTDADGYPIRRYERMDDVPRFPVDAPNGEGYLRHEDGSLILEDGDPWIPHLLIHFRRGGHALAWLAQAHGGANRLIEPTDHWVMRDQELHETLAVQRISEAMPHFVHQTLAMRMPAILDSFRRQARSLIEASGTLPDPVWLRTGPLRGTLDGARQEAESSRVRGYSSEEVAFYSDHLSTGHPQSNALSRALDWLVAQQPSGDAPVAEMTNIDWPSRILVVAYLAGQLRDLRVQRRQTLVEAHRHTTELFEGLLRAFFAHTSFDRESQNSQRTGISILFCEWVACQDGKASARSRRNDPYSHAWYKGIHGLIKTKFALAMRSPAPRLAYILMRIATRTESLTRSFGPPGAFIRQLLSTSKNAVGTGPWIHCLVDACELHLHGTDQRPQDRTVANLLLVGLMLIETRNLLTHGQEPLEVESPEGRAVVTGESGVSVILDAESLEMCFRLFIAAAMLVTVVGGLNPRRLDERDRDPREADRQVEQARIDRDTADRDLFLGIR